MAAHKASDSSGRTSAAQPTSARPLTKQEPKWTSGLGGVQHKANSALQQSSGSKAVSNAGSQRASGTGSVAKGKHTGMCKVKAEGTRMSGPGVKGGSQNHRANDENDSRLANVMTSPKQSQGNDVIDLTSPEHSG